MMVFSDRGIPNGYRHMNGYAINTFKLVNNGDKPVYNKFIFKVKEDVIIDHNDDTKIVDESGYR